jgi:PKD repeat protein
MCDDGNPCTADVCNNGVCEHIPLADGSACDDGDACTENDLCFGGNCAGSPVNCDDGDPSTFDFCDSGSGCYHVANNPPVADFTATPNPASVSETVQFDASESWDPEGYVITFQWDWEGDGTWDTGAGVNPLATHAYDTAGYYSATLKVTDEQGMFATLTIIIEVNP